MLLNKCKYAGCNELTQNSYCSLHTPIIDQIKRTNAQRRAVERKPFQGANNPNKKLYNSVRWRKLRAEWIKENPFCVFCGSRTDLTVDHLQRPKGDASLFFSPYNLRTLCRSCHYRHTGYENRKKKQ